MDTRTLIDSIVRQTTVLVAQLSTAAGIRAPLAHVADQVFVDLAREIERQGVRQKVVADMFGVALRTYQKKVQRLAESSSERGRTLWEAVVAFIAEEGPVARATLQRRFRAEEDRDVAAVLRDLTQSGLVYATGQGSAVVYGMSSAQDRAALRAEEQLASIQDFVWLSVFRNGPVTAGDLADALPYPAEAIAGALSALQADGRIQPDGQATGDGVSYRCTTLHIPVGASAGWEAAVLDHFQAVVRAIAAKLNCGAPRSREDDTVGGATLTFDVSADHPHRDEVLGLLKRVRTDVNVLWDRVEAHNASRPIDPALLQRICFYFGQYGPDEGE